MEAPGVSFGSLVSVEVEIQAGERTNCWHTVGQNFNSSLQTVKGDQACADVRTRVSRMGRVPWEDSVYVALLYFG